VNNADWRASASISTLKKYARIIQDIRAFFLQREVLEVFVPCIASSAATAPYLDSIVVQTPVTTSQKSPQEQPFFLQTSPEFFMKRLLCSDSGPIYSIAPAFRRGEISARHNPEFTMLEWYRPGWHYRQLMDEIEQLMVALFGSMEIERLSYRALFMEYTQVDPHCAELSQLEGIAAEKMGYLTPDADEESVSRESLPKEQSRDEWLELIFSGYILPKTKNRSLMIDEFPVGQAELAETSTDHFGNPVASRFELYVNGIELANGYQELTDVDELTLRLTSWNQQRKQLGKPVIPLDQYLIAAQTHGLPHCSGVALGVERLAMCLMGVSSIDEVLAFPIGRV